MKHKLLFPTLIFAVLFAMASCSKHEAVDPGSAKRDDQTDTPNVRKMFIGVHSTTSGNLIVGFTNSDSTFTQTDSLGGNFILSPNMDKHTSVFSKKNKRLYFIYRDAASRNLNVGTVNSVDGKYIKSIDLGVQQDDMIHLQYDDASSQLYFSMGPNIYEVSESTGALTNLKQVQAELALPVYYSSTINYLAHIIDSKRLIYVNDDKELLIFDRDSSEWDTLSIPNNGSYRSLVVDPSDLNVLYAYKFISASSYQLVKIELSSKTTAAVSIVNTNLPLLWFQARYANAEKIYTCRPFDAVSYPYFISIDSVSGNAIHYPTPSLLGQCLLD